MALASKSIGEVDTLALVQEASLLADRLNAAGRNRAEWRLEAAPGAKDMPASAHEERMRERYNAVCAELARRRPAGKES